MESELGRIIITVILSITAIVIVKNSLWLWMLSGKEKEVYDSLLRNLIMHPVIWKEALIQTVEKDLKKRNPDLNIDWKPFIKRIIRLMANRGWITEKGDQKKEEVFLYFERP